MDFLVRGDGLAELVLAGDAPAILHFVKVLQVHFRPINFSEEAVKHIVMHVHAWTLLVTQDVQAVYEPVLRFWVLLEGVILEQVSDVLDQLRDFPVQPLQPLLMRLLLRLLGIIFLVMMMAVLL